MLFVAGATPSASRTELAIRLLRVRERIRAAKADPAESTLWLEAYEAAGGDKEKLLHLPCFVDGLRPGEKLYDGGISCMIPTDAKGRPIVGPRRVTVRPHMGPAYFLPHVKRHSPTGFAWGYGGSGPPDLALSILVDLLGEKGDDPELYQAFKWTFVAGWNEWSWQIYEPEIREWLRWREEAKQRCPRQ